MVVVQLSWLSVRALVAPARGVLGLTLGDCRLFTILHFHHITSFNWEQTLSLAFLTTLKFNVALLLHQKQVKCYTFFTLLDHKVEVCILYPFEHNCTPSCL